MHFPPPGSFKELFIDLETHDPLLLESGPSWSHDEGYICGYGIAVDDQPAFYVPVRHKDGNLDEAPVLRWLQDVAAEGPVVWAHHLQYDLGWLRHAGIKFAQRTRYRCTRNAAAMLDELRVVHGKGYHLDELSREWLGREGKRPEKMLAYKEQHKLGKPKDDPRKFMAEYPADVVVEYAIGDVEELRALARYVESELQRASLSAVWDLESRLLPHLVEMRRRGIRLDIPHIERTLATWEGTVKCNLQELGVSSVWTAGEVASVFRRDGIAYPTTPKTKRPSITKEWLALMAAQGHETPQLVLKTRQFDKASQFLRVLLANEYRGRLYPEINQLKSDEGGTVTGRVSMVKPNPQQMPNTERFPSGGIGVRSSFLPDEGDEWCSLDYSQQEPRWLIHLAAGIARMKQYAHAVRLHEVEPFIEEYRSGKGDLHQRAADIIAARSRDIGRKAAKTVNLGLIYGQGKDLLAYNLGVPVAEAVEIKRVHRESIPFLQAVARILSEKAAQTGEIRSILGRRFLFNEWEPAYHEPEEDGADRPTGLLLEEAREKYGRFTKGARKGQARALKRAYAYRAINRWIQGSSADQTKKAWVECAEAGELPLLQVHDELNFSGSRASAERCREIMQDTMQLAVPVVADLKIGPNWATLKGVS